MQKKTTVAKELSLGDAVRQIALLANENHFQIPFKNEAPWHLLFYRLKRQSGSSKPTFLERLRFDSDGRYPRCRELSEFLQGLHTALTVNVPNPSYAEIVLSEDATTDWAQERKTLGKGNQEFLHTALELAKKEFPKKSRMNAQELS